MILYLTDALVRELITVDECNKVIEELFVQEAAGKVENRPTVELSLPKGVFRIKAGTALHLNCFGYKAYPFGGRYMVYVYDLDTGLDGVVEARGLTEARTGAVTAIGTKYMARPDATTAGMIGTGREARAQLTYIASVRPLTKVWCYSRDAEHRREYAADMSQRLGIEVIAAESGREAVQDADIVTTITNASQPVLLGEWLREGTHINGVGATSMSRRELDEHAVAKCGTVIVEHLPQASAELGELHYAANLGMFDWSKVREMKDVVSGTVKGRNSASEITLFDTIGVGAEDVAMAAYFLKKARAMGVGQEMPFEPPYVQMR